MATIAPTGSLAVVLPSLCTKYCPHSCTKPRRSWTFRPLYSFFPASSPGLRNLASCDNNHRSSRSSVIFLPKVVGGSVARDTVIAVLAASLFAVDPALAFKGGGPYGAEVTRGQDLTGKDFSGKSLIKQDFKTSILRQANFKGAKLQGASFFDADLTDFGSFGPNPTSCIGSFGQSCSSYLEVDVGNRPNHIISAGSDLSYADLTGADLSLANITKANLSNANLEGALVTGNTSFRGSNIIGTDFTDVPLRDDQREYLCNIADGVNPVTGNATRDTLNCN